ncbi:DEAD-box ATP-dependent RNA helicase 14-like [Carex rostrata]
MAKANVRYAPTDPSLPAPWKGLIDGTTGNLYFWNPLTKVTQYHRPSISTITTDATSTTPNATTVAPAPAPVLETIVDASPASPAPVPATSASTTVPTTTTTTTTIVSSAPLPARTTTDAMTPNSSIISPEAYCRQHEISVRGIDVPLPFTTFESTCFPPGLIRELYKAGFKEPTAIQAQSWPIAMQGKDIIAVAKTGSGKTLGFLIPGFICLKRLRNDPKSGPTMLVLSPTRELATQIQHEAVKFGGPAKITTTCLYGGAAKGPQLKELERGVDVVVATPGRLNDILEMGRLSLKQVAYLVLDEADRMLDMGFEPQIRKIAGHLPTRRQTLMFTATWPKEVRDIASHLLRNPIQVSIGSTDCLVANKAITQHVEVISPMEKRRRLDQILRSQDPNAKTIIFCSTKKMCDMLSHNLQHQYSAAAIHGDKSQPERDSVLADFRAGRSRVLVATDVAARGLDVKDIKVVVNYDFPNGVEDYVHRIGRTGRAGATGTAFTFFCDQDGKYATDLVKLLEGAGQKVPPELRDMVGRGGYGGPPRRWGGGGSNSAGGGDTGRKWSGAANGGPSGSGSRNSWGGSGGGGSGGGGSASGWGASGNGGSNGGGCSNGGGNGSGWNSSGSGFHDRSFSGAKEQSGARSRSRSPDKSFF